jgi:transposase
MPPKEAKPLQPVTRGYKYRIYPNQQQQQYLAKAFGSARFVYNHLLEQSSSAYQCYQSGQTTEKPTITNSSLSAALTQLKQTEGLTWLKEASSTSLQESAFNLAKAYKSFFALLQMLDANENESKNAKPLDKWVSEQTRNKDMQKFMEDHLIPDTDLSLSNFSDFVEKRKTILVQRIKKMIN